MGYTNSSARVEQIIDIRSHPISAYQPGSKVVEKHFPEGMFRRSIGYGDG
jgi:hypothetical protein